jgi:hypothetical protein
MIGLCRAIHAVSSRSGTPLGHGASASQILPPFSAMTASACGRNGSRASTVELRAPEMSTKGIPFLRSLAIAWNVAVEIQATLPADVCSNYHRLTVSTLTDASCYGFFPLSFAWIVVRMHADNKGGWERRHTCRRQRHRNDLADARLQATHCTLKLHVCAVHTVFA